MLWKLIRCVPKAGEQKAFSAAQEAWRSIRREPGFGGQCGGWLTVDQVEAWMLGLWQDRAAHEHFLKEGSHDAIVAGSGQLETLEDWSTDLLEQQEIMPGEHGDLPSALELAPPTAFLRLADCQVPAAQQDAFRTTQTELWLPTMGQAPGMLGGGYAWDGADRFVVATLWRDAQAHQAYVAQHLPDLRAEAKARGAYPETMSGRLVPLESRWTVLGKRLIG